MAGRIVLVLLFVSGPQAPPEETPQTLVGRFVAGDEGTVPTIRSQGPAVFPLLYPFRKQPRVRDLLRSIREEAASPEDRKLGARLAALKTRLGGGQGTFADTVQSLLGDGVRCVIDPREFEVIASAFVSIPKEGSSLDALEDICAESGTDFAFLYGVVLVARPDRLWPPLPVRRRPLSEAETARAKSLVSKLGSEVPEERDRAAGELRSLGPPVLPVLDGGALNPDPEISGRCRGLEEDLRPKPAPLFVPPAAERQALVGRDREFLASLRSTQTTFQVKDILLRHALKLLLSQVNRTLQSEESSTMGKVPEIKLTFSFRDVSYAAMLSVLTQCAGFDFMVEEGHLVVGPREEILSRLKR